jgi:hypothetical protein
MEVKGHENAHEKERRFAPEFIALVRNPILLGNEKTAPKLI